MLLTCSRLPTTSKEKCLVISHNFTRPKIGVGGGLNKRKFGVKNKTNHYPNQQPSKHSFKAR